VLVAGSAGTVAGLAGCRVYRREGEAPPTVEVEGGAGQVVARTGDVPVGGGVIVTDHRVVITQPTAGDLRGFSAICTHLGCTVATISDGTINCPCHGSRFSIEDGSVVQAATGVDPAQQAPLPTAEITVEGDEITLG
jgi:Rieske Fe-S protein